MFPTIQVIHPRTYHFFNSSNHQLIKSLARHPIIQHTIAMSVGFIDAVGLLSGGLGIVDFFKGLLPEDQAPQGTTVNIKVGISRIGDDVNNLVGSVLLQHSNFTDSSKTGWKNQCRLWFQHFQRVYRASRWSESGRRRFSYLHD